jgi:hypothetical protein
MSRFFAMALTVVFLVFNAAVVNLTSASSGLTIADVMSACSPACSLSDFTEQNGQVIYRLSNRYEEKNCVDFTFTWPFISFRVFLPLGRSRVGQVYPYPDANVKVEQVCAGVFTYKLYQSVPTTIFTAQELCRPVVECSLDHFTEDGGLIMYDHELDGHCPGITLAPGMFFDYGSGHTATAPYRYLSVCQVWIGGEAIAPHFSDVDYSSVEGKAIRSLVLRDVVHGNGDGTFGPDQPVLRAQMAALIARTLNVDLEDHHTSTSFTDRGEVDNILWGNVGTLAYYDIIHGYGDGTFGPTNPVLRAQVISFITRAMVHMGCWNMAPDVQGTYPNVPDVSGHRQDIATYAHYVGPLASRDGNPYKDFPDWDKSAPRWWVAEKLEWALEAGCK